MSLQTTTYQVGMAKWPTLILLTVSAVACSSLNPTLSGPTGRAFTEADMLFQQDPRWLGADAALSVPLSEGRILWLVDDTFVATNKVLSL